LIVGGKLYFTIFTDNSDIFSKLKSLKSKLTDWPETLSELNYRLALNDQNPAELYFNCLTEDEFKKNLVKAGFEIERIEYFNLGKNKVLGGIARKVPN
jgi:hypothetical protein